MARRELTVEQLELVQAVRTGLREAGLPATERGADRPPSTLGGPAVNGRATTVRVGCSGGADSMALLAATCHLARREPGLDVQAVVVDHRIQPGSDEVARQVAERARALGARAVVEAVSVDGRGGLEAAARDARLAALTRPGLPVLLGHTLDDQAETVLLGLARGSGAASVQGMAARRGLLLRPLLGVRRQVTRRACEQWGIEVWEDPMNDSTDLARVRVRQALPLLADALGEHLPLALARTATLLRQDNRLLDELADDALADALDGGPAGAPRGTLDCAVLAALDPALRSRVVRCWLVDGGVEQPGMEHVTAVLALVEHWHGQRGVDLPGGVRARRLAGRLLLVVPDGRGHRAVGEPGPGAAG